MSNLQQPLNDPNSNSLDQAINRSIRELQLLANFYHGHGYEKQAQEIYRTILHIREENEKQEKGSPDQEEGR